MRSISIFHFLFLPISILSVIPIQAIDKPIDPVKWSSYQGKKSWKDAKEHCASMNQRLPYLSELITAKDAGTTVSWRANGSRFWSIDKKPDPFKSTYKAIHISSDSRREIHTEESVIGFYCANITEGSAKEEARRVRREFLISQFVNPGAPSKLPWEDAVEKCESLKMRLPTIEEILEVHELGLLKDFDLPSGYYWSSTRNPERSNSYQSLEIYSDWSGGVSILNLQDSQLNDVSAFFLCHRSSGMKTLP